MIAKLKTYGGNQKSNKELEGVLEPESEPESEPGFATPPPCPWCYFNTPITNTERKRGSEYIRSRIIAGPLTPVIIRVMEKVDKASDRMIVAGQLSTELL